PSGSHRYRPGLPAQSRPSRRTSAGFAITSFPPLSLLNSGERMSNYTLSKLSNGLTVATVALPHMSSVSVGLWLGVGGRYEPAPLSGASHFIEHMLFKGTRKRTAAQISQSVEGLGGYLNAFTSEEMTCFYSKARHDKFDELLEVLVDMFLN